MTPDTNRRTITDHLGALGRWWIFIALLTSKNAGERFHLRSSDWAGLLAIAEPLAFVFVVGYARHALFNSAPQFGTSSVLFTATGMLPYYLFYHTSQKIRGLDSIRNVPMASWADNAIAFVIGEITVKIFIMLVLFFGLWMTGVPDAVPVNPIGCLAPLTVMAILGLSVGVANAIIASVFEMWHYIYAVAVRVLMVLSAVFFVLDFVPRQFRDIAVYNPIAQAITWLRADFYRGYPIATLDIPYTLVVTALMLLLAMMVEAETRKWRPSR